MIALMRRLLTPRMDYHMLLSRLSTDQRRLQPGAPRYWTKHRYTPGKVSQRWEYYSLPGRQ